MIRKRKGAAPLVVRCVALAAALVSPTAATAATSSDHGAAPPQVKRATPRQTVTGFLAAAYDGDFALAAHYLDLGGLPPEARAQEGMRRARRLFLVVLRRAALDPEAVSDNPEGSAKDAAEPRREPIATLVARGKEVPVVLERVADPAAARVWLVSRDTVEEIHGLYRASGYGWIGDRLPSVFFSLSFAGLQLWQWVALAVALLFGYGVARLVGRVMLLALAGVARRTSARWDDALVRALDGPLAVVLWGLALTVTSGWVGLAPGTAAIAHVVWRLLTLSGVGWMLLRLWDGVATHMRRTALEQNQVALAYIPLISRTGKFVVGVIVVLGALDVVGVNVVAMLAGLGIGGVAIAFAAQKTIENIFGAVTIAGDRPFMIGDYVTVGGVSGTVEEIGLRSTRLRTDERTLVTVPNSAVAADKVVNFTARDRFLYNPRLGLRYGTTVEQLTWIIDEIRKVLITHPKVWQDTHRVRFAGFGDSSFDLAVFSWLLASDYNESTAVAEELNFAIARIVERSGTSFAFPSQTLYLTPQQPPSPERAEEIAREVEARREHGELAVPEPPPGLADRLRGKA